MNDPLFSREALLEYTKHPEKSAHVKAMKQWKTQWKTQFRQLPVLPQDNC